MRGAGAAKVRPDGDIDPVLTGCWGCTGRAKRCGAMLGVWMAGRAMCGAETRGTAIRGAKCGTDMRGADMRGAKCGADIRGAEKCGAENARPPPKPPP
jgi:hypothetical protein